jgi:Rps23 Pro-64 3,4-dihydroxylase Tpa1-like proline 4-hydroxylase
MIVLDNFYPQSLIDSVVLNSSNYEWKFGRSDKNDDVYWTIPVYGNNALKESKIESDFNHNYSFIESFKYKEIENCWDYIKNNVGLKISDKNLNSCYLNGLTHGIEAHAHIDGSGENNVTIICYVCDSWNSHWGGDTCFYSMEYSNNPADKVFYSHEITKSVLPRYNRVLIFNGNIVHSVKPLSKTFKDIRKTLMFKLVDVNMKDLHAN